MAKTLKIKMLALDVIDGIKRQPGGPVFDCDADQANDLIDSKRAVLDKAEKAPRGRASGA